MPKPNDDSAKDNQLDILVDDLIHNIGSKQCCDIMSQIETSILKNMPVTCYLCFICSETKQVMY